MEQFTNMIVNMPRLKIGLWAEHAGLIDVLRTLWEEHDVRLAPRWDGFHGQTWQGDEDIIISTLPYKPESLLTGKPTIVYFTDPIQKNVQKQIQELFDDNKITVIGAEDCYPDDLYIEGIKQCIPFALKRNNYPPFIGYKPSIAVVNQKPVERWHDVVTGALKKFMSLEELFGDIPYEIIREDSTSRFRLRYAEHRGLFYFSNSPYTIVMFEAMLVGMPIVAWDHHHRWANYKPIHKYLTSYSTDVEEIRTMLRKIIASPPTKQTYQYTKFEEVQDLWNNLFERVLLEK